VIDAGTALTFTGVNQQQQLIGGAILPGLKLQLQSLGNQTAALPQIQLPQSLPIRWSTNTPQAIASGVIYTVLAGLHNFITDWYHQFPDSQIIFTGGDSSFLLQSLQKLFPAMATKINIDPNLIFWGARLVYLENS
jgi:type III pantothenate kinase